MKNFRWARSVVNGAISRLTVGMYFDKIPLDEIFAIMKKSEMEAVQEDGTKWSGFLCGKEGRAHIAFKFEGEPFDKSVLYLSWYQMQSGRFEVVCYLS